MSLGEYCFDFACMRLSFSTSFDNCSRIRRNAAVRVLPSTTMKWPFFRWCSHTKMLSIGTQP